MLAGVLILVNQHLTATALNATAAGDHGLVARLLRDEFLANDLDGIVVPERRAVVEATFRDFAADQGLQAIRLYDAAGSLRFGEADADGSVRLAAERLAEARSGQASIAVEPPTEAGAQAVVGHFPITTSGGLLRGVVVTERDAGPLLALAGAALRDIVLVVGVGALVLAGLLFLVFRAAQQLLSRRTAQLLESTRRDALTGLLNHGAIVAELVTELEAARGDGGWVIAALIDIDGFRLLNETHGYAAGDRALLVVADALGREAPEGALLGRFGPDEFLLVGPAACAPQVRPAIERLRERLAMTPVAFPGTEPFLFTVSGGMASYPEHAASATELLSVATAMLVEARTGGGNRMRVDAPDGAGPPGIWDAFGVLEGLVVSVAAKDLYTKAHSEEVADLAVYLAERLGLQDPPPEVIRRAGLLHDVGKIGVPDRILRKPGPLTDEERAVMQQHTVIGDTITRSLPGMEGVARGVRHHHERWDGTGYPDALGGSDIPLVARLISVADAYSAMTTSRSYRSALPVSEALRRIEEGAGTQFDPALAQAFVRAVGELPEAERQDRIVGHGDSSSSRVA